MNNNRSLAVAVCGGVSLAICQAAAARESSTTLNVAPKYACLNLPNSADQAGAVLRTVDGSVAAREGISPDDLVRAYTTKPTGILVGPFTDIEQRVARGIDGNAEIGILKRIGVALSLKGNARYSVTLRAVDNRQYTAGDDQRAATLRTLTKSGGRIEGARYYFVKEAIGSADLTYEVTDSAGATVNANVKAADSGLGINLTAKDSGDKVSTKKELIACVVLEPFTFDVIHGDNGALTFSVSSGPTLKPDEARRVLTAQSN